MKVLTKPEIRTYAGGVYCPICTHTVEAEVQTAGKLVRVKPGQKCSRCAASLDAGYVLRHQQAA
jgi:uncharacterized Zn finger protein (UPF0148 family)